MLSSSRHGRPRSPDSRSGTSKGSQSQLSQMARNVIKSSATDLQALPDVVLQPESSSYRLDYRL